MVLPLGGTIRRFGFVFPDVRSEKAISKYLFIVFPTFVLMKQFSFLFVFVLDVRSDKTI